MSSIMLTVVGEDLDPEVVSAALGMEPDQTWRRGERASFTRPDGTVRLLNCVNEGGGWKKFMPEQYEGETLFDQLLIWRVRLRDLRGTIWRLRNRGWIAELICYVDSVDALILFNNQLRELADLGIDLSFDMFPP